MKRKWLTMIAILVIIAGISIILYPTASDWLNNEKQEQNIADYQEAVGKLQEGDYDALWQAAEAYNRELADRTNPFKVEDEDLERYNSLLNVSEKGIMGYLVIPKIHVTLPFYHGTEEEVLQTAIGHMIGSSLPTGGESTHCVFSGHNGLPSAKLFTNLEKMEEGDRFELHVLDRTLVYEVDRILIADPKELFELEIVKGQDYCTLMTCTPYGVNTHRLLVRGHRVFATEGGN